MALRWTFHSVTCNPYKKTILRRLIAQKSIESGPPIPSGSWFYPKDSNTSTRDSSNAANVDSNCIKKNVSCKEFMITSKFWERLTISGALCPSYYNFPKTVERLKEITAPQFLWVLCTEYIMTYDKSDYRLGQDFNLPFVASHVLRTITTAVTIARRMDSR